MLFSNAIFSNLSLVHYYLSLRTSVLDGLLSFLTKFYMKESLASFSLAGDAALILGTDDKLNLLLSYFYFYIVV